ncbi:hypothetical protein ACS0TY_013641 [Phlomoides rotata]
MECWEDLSFQLRYRTEGMDLGEWVMAEVQHMSKENAALFAALLWSVWFARNEKLFGNRVVTGQQIKDMALRHLAGFQSAKLQSPLVRENTQPVKWTPPPSGSFKLNVDAAFQPGIGVGLGGATG